MGLLGVLLLGVGLSLDTFAVSLSLGFAGCTTHRQRMRFLIVIGIFHFLMIMAGWFLGENACDGSLLTNPRQFGALDRASRAIERAKAGLGLGVTPDAVLTDVEEAMAALGEVTGRTVREDITNRIFERFCVGK